MNLYLDSGFLDFKKIVDLDLPFNFVVGGRGTGKTYGALSYLIDNNIKFMFMRRTQSQVDLINKPDFSPFKAINEDKGTDISSQSITKYSAGFYHSEKDEDGKIKCKGAPLGYTCALSTISNMRGFDASDIEMIIYDEFIPERHEKPIRAEASALLNAYETINRNRELKGQKPVQMICLANANDMANPIFVDLNLVRKATSMYKKGQEFSIDRNRGIGLFVLQGSPISDAKRNTALYKVNKDSEFNQMALDNRFASATLGMVNPRPLIEYRPIVQVGEICIYKHKSNNMYYVSTHTQGSPQVFTSGETDIIRFCKLHGNLWLKYLDKHMEFEEELCEILFNTYFT